MGEHQALYERVEGLRLMLVSKATGKDADDAEYKEIRQELMQDSLTADNLPPFIRTCRNLDDFWTFIKAKFSHYQERRDYIKEQLEPLLGMLEGSSSSPSDKPITDSLKETSIPGIQQAWKKALDRRNTDPEGAITASRSLLETVCKHILDEMVLEYDDSMDLPSLYNLVAQNLNLSPSQHTEKPIKQILGGCISIVNGMASVRNRLSDAHGRSQRTKPPSIRDAELAVNLSGTMATFLIATWKAQGNG